MSEDPIRFKALDANLYRYVGNSPSRNVDARGLQFAKAKTPVNKAYVDQLIKDALRQNSNGVFILGLSHDITLDDATRGRGGAIMYKDLSELLTEANKITQPQGPKCGCIAVLELWGHARYSYKYDNRQGGIQMGSSHKTAKNGRMQQEVFYDTKAGDASYLSPNNVEWVGRQLKTRLPLCPNNPVIILGGCNTGNYVGPKPDVPELLAKGSGAIVVATGGWGKGSFYGGTAKVEAVDENGMNKTLYQYFTSIDNKDLKFDWLESQDGAWYIARP